MGIIVAIVRFVFLAVLCLFFWALYFVGTHIDTVFEVFVLCAVGGLFFAWINDMVRKHEEKQAEKELG